VQLPSNTLDIISTGTCLVTVTKQLMFLFAIIAQQWYYKLQYDFVSFVRKIWHITAESQLIGMTNFTEFTTQSSRWYTENRVKDTTKIRAIHSTPVTEPECYNNFDSFHIPSYVKFS
jgi:hypothetical protein